MAETQASRQFSVDTGSLAQALLCKVQFAREAPVRKWLLGLFCFVVCFSPVRHKEPFIIDVFFSFLSSHSRAMHAISLYGSPTAVIFIHTQSPLMFISLL